MTSLSIFAKVFFINVPKAFIFDIIKKDIFYFSFIRILQVIYFDAIGSIRSSFN